MGDVIKIRRPSLQKRPKGKILCRSGFHKWEVDKQSPFDVKEGRLVSGYRCSRCGALRTESR